MKQLFALALILCGGGAFAQVYVAGHQMPSDNFYDIRDYINTHLRKTTGMTHNEEASEGDHLYDRWIDYWKDHVNPDGSFPAPDHTYQEMLHYRQTHPVSASRSTGNPPNWRQMSVSYPASNAPGIGRVDRVDFNSTNPNHLYISSPSGSFWESLDQGATWRAKTDQLPIIGTSGIAVDPTDSNIIYLATGDGEANADNPSIGVLKSFDGGSTWRQTGLSFIFTAGQKYISRIQMNPTDPTQLLVAASNGIYRTTDSGATWANRLAGNFRDVRYMPLSGAVCYAVTNTSFYRSIDSGKTWLAVTTGNPGTSDRMSIAVTPAMPARVYLLAGGPTGLVGVYLSDDTGNTWSTQATSPNLFSYSPNGSDNFSQSWYTASIAASPTNPNLLFSGGANVWSSADAGVTWTCQTTGDGFGYGMVHVDIHELHFSPDGSALYVGCDGGIYRNDLSQSNWAYISNGLENTQVYRIALSDGDTNVIMYGAQDNDVVVYNSGNWDGDNLHADGFGCAIDPTNSNIMFGASQYGGINKSFNKGASWNGLNIGNQNADWDAPYKMNKLNPNELFAGMDNFYVTTNGGNSWTQLGDLGNSADLFTAFAYCETNTQVMYATYYSPVGTAGLFKSTDGGTTWANLNNHDIAGLNIKSIEVCPNDPDRVWITIGGYQAGKKVFYSYDGGQTFYNITGSLPNISANTIVYQTNSNDVVYLGMDNGVYVGGDSLTDWVLYDQNLPNAIVKELKIRYRTNELFAGTYGRGVWRTKLYQQDPNVGIATIAAAPRIVVYPNPVTDDLIIEMRDGLQGEATVVITSAAGQLVKELETEEDKISIPCADLSPGIYFVSYQVNGSKAVKKFVKL